MDPRYRGIAITATKYFVFKCLGKKQLFFLLNTMYFVFKTTYIIFGTVNVYVRLKWYNKLLNSFFSCLAKMTVLVSTVLQHPLQMNCCLHLLAFHGLLPQIHSTLKQSSCCFLFTQTGHRISTDGVKER